MKVLMIGWEFPPFFAGGAGIVCNELSKALLKQGADITFIMPSGPDDIYENLNTRHSDRANFRIVIANNRYKNVKLKIRKINSLLTAYAESAEYQKIFDSYLNRGQYTGKPIYGKNLKEEVYRFAEQVKLLAEEEDFDVIHAHDWVTFPAAVALKELTGKPMVIHVHITEFDKTGNNSADPEIYAIEKQGMDKADRVIVVSEKIRQRCIDKYYINPEKIRIVHNAATQMNENKVYDGVFIKSTDKIVLFAGRVTLQKGPDYFVDAAAKVLEKVPNTVFVIAGTGDMLPQIIEKVAYMGLSSKFIFTGFYNRDQAEQLFSMANVFVMPSVSEPFGLVPYEAQMKRTPTIISKQSGISEVLYHTLKVDFWDVNQLANKILALLSYKSLHAELSEKGYYEAKTATWDIPAAKCLNIYNEILGRG